MVLRTDGAPPARQGQLLARVKKIRGQLNAVETAISGEDDCSRLARDCRLPSYSTRRVSCLEHRRAKKYRH